MSQVSQLAVDFYTYIFKFAFTWLDSKISNSGFGRWLDSVLINGSRAWIDVYGPKWKEILSYVYYFIPKSYLQPFITMIIVFLSVRVIFALFRVITDLL